MKRGILAVLVILSLLLAEHATVSAADSEDETVEQKFNDQQNQQEKERQGNNGSESVDQEPDQNATAPSSGSSGYFVSFLKLFFALFLILALIYLLYYFVGRRKKTFQEGRALENLGGVSVGANRSVQLIRVGSEVLVIGVGDTVELIKEIRDPDAIRSLQQEKKPEGVDANVRKVLDWATKKTLRTKGRTPVAPIQVQFKEKLDRLVGERSVKVETNLRKDEHDERHTGNTR